MSTQTYSEASPYSPVEMHTTSRRNGLALATFTGATMLAGAVGSIASRDGIGLWYTLLRKPSFQPPREVFGPVWTVLYGAIALSGWRVWKQPRSTRRSISLGLWGVQLALNAAWPWLFFGRRRPRAALVDEAALLGSIGAYGIASSRIDRGAAWLMAPYFGWVSFATVLNREIVRLNPQWRG